MNCIAAIGETLEKCIAILEGCVHGLIGLILLKRNFKDDNVSTAKYLQFYLFVRFLQIMQKVARSIFESRCYDYKNLT